MKITITILAVLIISTLAAGCAEITQKNIDPVAKRIQEKYDNINSYQATIISVTSEGNSKSVLRQVRRPDMYKELKFSADGKKHNTFMICNQDTYWGYVDGSDEIVESRQDCREKVDDFFSVFEEIKSIFDYKEYEISESEVNGDEAFKLSLESSYGSIYIFWFSKEDYQLIKRRTVISGREQTDIWQDLQLNIEIPDSEFQPNINIEKCKIDIGKAEQLQQELEEIIGKIDENQEEMLIAEFEQYEEILYQVNKARCKEYIKRTYEEYISNKDEKSDSSDLAQDAVPMMISETEEIK